MPPTLVAIAGTSADMASSIVYGSPSLMDGRTNISNALIYLTALGIIQLNEYSYVFQLIYTFFLCLGFLRYLLKSH